MTDAFHFDGFKFPNSTQIPDEAFDLIMPRVSPAEWVVLCYIMRRTLGFKKRQDDISLKQMVDGIKRRNGEQLDQGTGLGKATVVRCLKRLAEMGVIQLQRHATRERGNVPTTYVLRFQEAGPVDQSETPLVSERDTPLVSNGDKPLSHPGPTPLSHAETPLVSERDTQKTVRQKTESTPYRSQHTEGERSRARVRARGPSLEKIDGNDGGTWGDDGRTETFVSSLPPELEAEFQVWLAAQEDGDHA
jgi:hypothetical protein